jgi:hypothetical protein
MKRRDFIKSVPGLFALPSLINIHNNVQASDLNSEVKLSDFANNAIYLNENRFYLDKEFGNYLSKVLIGDTPVHDKSLRKPYYYMSLHDKPIPIEKCYSKDFLEETVISWRTELKGYSGIWQFEKEPTPFYLFRDVLKGTFRLSFTASF